MASSVTLPKVSVTRGIEQHVHRGDRTAEIGAALEADEGRAGQRAPKPRARGNRRR